MSDAPAAAVPHWVSWQGGGAFTLHTPWWVSGYVVAHDADGMEDGEEPLFVAAVMAPDVRSAQELIRKAHDNMDAPINFRFAIRRDAGWEPFTDRFPRAKWMQWPPPP